MPETQGMTVELVGDTELLMSRWFAAEPELVWQAWTDPEHFAQWWGPHTFRTTVERMDVRPGGICHYRMQSDEYGDAGWARCEYLEVEPPGRLVYVDAFADAEGNVMEGMATSTCTVTFEARDGGTLLTLHSVYASAEDRAQVLEMGMQEGMGETLERLAAHVEAHVDG